jgi:hypothetical protein
MTEVLPPPSRVATENARISGFLWKRGELNRAWQQRWCVLVDTTLWYFKSKDASVPLKGIKLDQCVVRQTDAESATRPLAFEIVTKQRAFLLAADSRDALHKWLEELALCTSLQSENLLIERAENLIRQEMRAKRLAIVEQIDRKRTSANESMTSSVASEIAPAAAATSAAAAASTAGPAAGTAVVAVAPRRAAVSVDESVAPRFETKREWAIEALRAGSFEVARDLLLELLEVDGRDRHVLFFLACAESLLRRRPESLRYIELAIKNGFANLSALQNDVDLQFVRTLPEWAPLIDRFASALHVFTLMRQSQTGVEVKRRAISQRIREDSFVGRDAVDWLMRNRFSATREMAVSKARDLMAHGLIRSAEGEREFEDSDAVFVFQRDDDQREEAVPAAPAKALALAQSQSNDHARLSADGNDIVLRPVVPAAKTARAEDAPNDEA